MNIGAVASRPLTGSSFVQSAVAPAARLRLCTLTNIAADGGRSSSLMGMNGREQELDELAIILQTYRTRGAWVAQHHTRFTPYLGEQLRFYRITPIVTVRNIFDAIVSMDDMVMATRQPGEWNFDPPYSFPSDYPQLDPADRLTLLAQDFGVWLIKFLVSWRRAAASDRAQPLILSYERDVLNPDLLGARLNAYLGLDETESADLAAFLEAPPGERTRFNKGVAGRGQSVPREARTMLLTLARRFESDLGEEGMRLLFGDRPHDVESRALG